MFPQLWQQFLFRVPGKQKGNCPAKQTTQGLLASILFKCSHFYRNKKMQSSNNVSQCLPKNKYSSLTLKHGHLPDLWLGQPLKDHCKGKQIFFFPPQKRSLAYICLLQTTYTCTSLSGQEEEMGFCYYFQEEPEASTVWVYNQAHITQSYKPTYVM